MRPSWQDYFMTIARAVSSRATCAKKQVGCVLVNAQNEIVATGYNGSPSGEPHCIDVGCLLVSGRCIRTRHAERNALEHLGHYSGNLTCYTTLQPCAECFAELRKAQVTSIVFEKKHSHAVCESDIPLIQWKGPKLSL
jgi:dCMP deaminase